MDIAHGVALTTLLPDVLRFNLPVRTERLADVAFALGAGDTHAGAGRNAAAAIEAVAALREQVGLTAAIADFGITRRTSPRSPPTPSTTRCWPTPRASRRGGRHRRLLIRLPCRPEAPAWLARWGKLVLCRIRRAR